MKLPTLYKKTSTGAIQEWTIYTSNGSLIVTEFGQVGGKIQLTEDLVIEGKNIGKVNETTPAQQAQAEAKAKWEKQKKKGYVESIADAQADKLDDLIEGGVLPMLAFTFAKQGKKIKYPCFTQPKLDGIRMIAILKNGKCTLWSRSRKPITSLPHIVEEIEKNFSHLDMDIILDGEAYNHKFKTNFEHIVHLVRQEEPDAQCTDVEYHVYDIINDEYFSTRTQYIEEIFDEAEEFEFLKRVETVIIQSEDDVPEYFTKYRDQGYEGAMLRNSNGLYVSKRSSNLIKVKEMQDDEFKIVGIEEGRGKLQGHVGAFLCITKDGNEFSAKMSGDTGMLKKYFEDHSLWAGMNLTVQFQDYTAYGKPRFPVGLRIRLEE